MGSANVLHGHTFMGGLILQGPDSSVEVLYVELLGTWGCVGWEVPRATVTLHPQNAACSWSVPWGFLGTGCIHRSSLDLPGRNCLKYRATFTSVTQRKLSSSFCRRCSLH